jgi:hypothetical protein
MVAQHYRDVPGIEDGRPTMPQASLGPRRFLRRSEAARYVENKWGYPCSPKTLAKKATIGGGPRFRKAARFPVYEPCDLDDWVRGLLTHRVGSTSELIAK